MTKIDDAIRGSLSKEDVEFLAGLDAEPGALRQMAGIFHGSLRWFYVLFFAFALIVGLVGVYAGWRFAISTELRPLFYWGGATGFCLVVLAVVRVLFFMQMHTNRLLLELKRVELQVARLAAKSGS